jgi:hypothetical protein
MEQKAGAAALFQLPPRRRYELIQEFRRAIDGEAGIIESVDNLLNGRLLVIEGYCRDVGVLIDFHFFRLYNVCEGPTDPVPGEGSLAVRQQELHGPHLGHCGRCADQDDKQYCDQHKKR